MLKFVYGFLLITIQFNCTAQDSLVRQKDIKFSSAFEKDAFTRFFKQGDRAQSLALFISLSNDASNDEVKNISNRIGGISSALTSGGIDKKKPEKQVKAIYDLVHSSLLRKYEMENRFHEIFTSGNYNCVTATAVYSLVFENLKIPYEIKEEPTHVYLLAYPNANNILVETTAPMYGFLNFDSKFKQNFIDNLKDQKVIGNSEIESKSLEELFNTYYFKNDKIDLTKLIGIHYMNDALFKNDHNNAKEAYQQAQKAYWFYPSPRCEFLLTHFGAVAINSEKNAKDKAMMIGQLSRLTKQGITAEMIKGEFTNLTQDILFKNNNKTLYRECYEIIEGGIQDRELADDISYIYNYENGRVYYNQGNNALAQPFFEKAMKLQPNNVDLGGIYVGVISRNLRHVDNGKAAFDSLELYRKKFPSLSENNNFNSLVALATVVQMSDEFKKGNATAGEVSRAKFEGMMKSNRDLNVAAGAIGSAYSSACAYYFKKSQKAKAREIVNKGLELAPGNYELRTRQQMMQ
jgi:tetratricopeptide (TPR) repeat protein